MPEAPKSPAKVLAILSALPEEQGDLIQQLSGARRLQLAGREVWQGSLQGQEVVMALSRIGKVAAATTATALIERFDVRGLLFTGVAGGVGPGVQVGDVVVGTGFVQHDMNAAPLFPRYEIPLTGQTLLPADAALTEVLHDAAQAALRHLNLGSYPSARVHQGLIASGDQFVASAAHSQNIVAGLQALGHQPLAVEMEGAAVAQVCADYGLPFAAVRTISDRADDAAHVDFPRFVKDVASQYAQHITLSFLQRR